MNLYLSESTTAMTTTKANKTFDNCVCSLTRNYGALICLSLKDTIVPEDLIF